MKAAERHRLKTNRLAELLGETPEYLRKYMTHIVTAVVILAVAAVVLSWWWSARIKTRQERSSQLQEQLNNGEVIQLLAAYKNRIEADPAKTGGIPKSYNPEAIETGLGNIAEASAGTPVGMTALLQKAQMIRSILLFSDQPISLQQRQLICQQAEQLYRRILQEYPQDKSATGNARLGLGLIAEEKGEWDKAKQIYQEMTTDNTLAGTIYPMEAQRRLELISSIDKPIQYAAASITPPAPPTAELNETPPTPAPTAAKPEQTTPEPTPEPEEKTIP